MLACQLSHRHRRRRVLNGLVLDAPAAVSGESLVPPTLWKISKLHLIPSAITGCPFPSHISFDGVRFPPPRCPAKNRYVAVR